MEPIVQDIKAAVRRYIEDNFIMGAGGVALADGDSFLEHHVLDSTGFLELIGHLEETYGIKVLDDEMVPENLDSLDSVAAFVARKRGA
jgi:acyl carrier protein